MPLTFDEVGQMYDDAVAKSRSRGEAAMQTRQVIGEHALTELGIDDLSREHVAMLLEVNEMLSGVGMYIAYQGILKVTDLASHVLRLVTILYRLCGYLEDHWDELPQSRIILGWRREHITVTRQALESDLRMAIDGLESGGALMIKTLWFQVIVNMGPIFYGLTLGDDRADQLIELINTGNRHLNAHIHIAKEVERMTRDTNPQKPKES